MIREAVLGDVQAIADIIVRAWQTAYEGVIDPAFPKTIRPEKYLIIMTENISQKSETIFVFERDGRVIGFVSGLPAEKPYDAEVRGLYVDPDAQGQGAGSQLLETMLNFLRAQAYKKVILWTLEGVKNNTFYTDRGGVITEHRDLEIGGKEYRGVGFMFRL